MVKLVIYQGPTGSTDTADDCCLVTEKGKSEDRVVEVALYWVKKKTKTVYRRLEHEFQTDRARGEASEIGMMLFLGEGRTEMTAMKAQREREGDTESGRVRKRETLVCEGRSL